MIINGAPSGRPLAYEDFEQMVKARYATLLQTEQYRFVGDATDWQMKQGRESSTAEKEYLVEVQTNKGEHLLVKFKCAVTLPLH